MKTVDWSTSSDNMINTAGCWLLVGECVTAPRKMCICIYIPVFCFYTAVMWGATLVILNITILPSTIDTCILLLGERITRTTQPRSLTTDYPRCPLTFPVWTQHCFSWRLYCITNFCAFTLGWFKILILGSWDIYTSHLICTTLMSISSYLDDLIMHFPLRASHRKFSGTVGVIENRTSLNPP